MNTKHTPGPWEVRIENGTHCIRPADYYTVGHTYGYGPIAKVSGDKRIGCQLENARLIDAALELLAVLQELQESAAYWSEYDVPIGITERINAAIAKATGADHDHT